MKMRELQNMLEKKNVIVTERMVRHYLELGLLPEPERPSKNQAIYNEEHFKRLLAIDMFKSKGLSLDEIKTKMDELLNYFLNYRGEAVISDPDILVLKKFDEISLDRSLIEAEYPHLAQTHQLYSWKQLIKELNCSEKKLKAAIKFLGMRSEEYFDSIDMFAIKTCLFYQKARELYYHFDNTIPELYDQDVPYDLNIEKELNDAFEAAKTIVRTANMNPFLNILLKAMIAYTAKESLLNREISDISWEGLHLGWEYKTQCVD